jgi:hypothetical protein
MGVFVAQCEFMTVMTADEVLWNLGMCLLVSSVLFP